MADLLHGLKILAAAASVAFAKSAHIKVEFYAKPGCHPQDLKPGNARDPSDLNANKDECESPDHHLPTRGFNFQSLRYWFVGDDWKDDKYAHCTLIAFQQDLCNGPGTWNLPADSGFFGANATKCHDLSENGDESFKSLRLLCEKDESKSNPVPFVVSTPHAITKTMEVTSTDVSVDSAGSTVTKIFPVVSEYIDGEDTLEIRPTESIIEDGDTTTISPQATVTASDISFRRRFHARDVTAKSAMPSRCVSCDSTFPASTSHAPEPTSVEVVIDEHDFFDLIVKLGEDLGGWIDDLQTAVETVEDDAKSVDCHDDDCDESDDEDCDGDECSEDDESEDDYTDN